MPNDEYGLGILTMYRRSGGSTSDRRCGQCYYCQKNDDGNKHCVLNDKIAVWHPDWVACRFFISPYAAKQIARWRPTI